MSLEINCVWDFHDDNPMNELMVTKSRLAKLILLWRRTHIIDQHFISRVVQPWTCETDYNKLETPYCASMVLRYALAGESFLTSHMVKDIERFLCEHWGFLSPNTDWKVKVNFSEGTTPSVTI